MGMARQHPLKKLPNCEFWEHDRSSGEIQRPASLELRVLVFCRAMWYDRSNRTWCADTTKIPQ